MDIDAKRRLLARNRTRRCRKRKRNEVSEFNESCSEIETDLCYNEKIRILSENEMNVNNKSINDDSEISKTVESIETNIDEEFSELFECVSVSSDNIDNNSDEDFLYFSDEDSDVNNDNGSNENEESIPNKLKEWALTSNTPHTQIEKLFNIIKPVVKDLPKTPKTFFESTSGQNHIIEEFPSSSKNPRVKSEYVYFGIAENLKRLINVMAHLNFLIILQFFVDGLPLYKSSTVQFWPLLGYIVSECNLYEPFIVACFCGPEKPSNSDLYFDKFVKEINVLLRDGLMIDGFKFEINLWCFLADRPARAFSKSIINHGGFFACERCEVKGITYMNRRVYPGLDKNSRTDKSFRDFKNVEHHKGFSFLCSVEPKIDMVKDFPLEILHLVYLGIIKKMLAEFWLAGASKLSAGKIGLLSKRLLELAKQIPCEFQRSTRSLDSVSLWKGTEFRMFCLYFGILVTFGILSDKLHKHYTLLVVSLRILHDPALFKSHIGFARQWLQEFFTLFGDYYGLESLSLNVHSILHLPDDIENFQCSPSKISTFLFESFLGKLKPRQ